MQPKYSVGDELLMGDDTRVKVKEVIPTSIWRPTQKYRIELVDSPGATAEVPEDALWEPMRQLPFNMELLCNCGSKNVPGFENCHSFWCSAYIKKEEQ